MRTKGNSHDSQTIDSLDLVETVMVFKEVFGTEVQNDDLEHFGSPSEIVDRLESTLVQRPNKAAKAWLKGLAKEQQRPELEGQDGTWRREQIAAMVREMLR
jgi:hypothetical protein